MSGDPQFDAAFRVDIANPAVIQAVLTPAVKQYCMSAPHYPFYITGPWIFTWVEGQRQLQAIEREFQYLDGLVARLPVFGAAPGQGV